MTALTILLLILFISLGQWQWDRAKFKSQLFLQFTANQTSLTDLSTISKALELTNRSTLSLPRFAEVRVTGRWDGARQFLLDNRMRYGKAGYEVLTPLRLEDGRWLLVNRGWVPFGGYRDQLPNVSAGLAPLQALQILHGKLDELPVAGLAVGRAAPALSGIWPRVTAYPRIEELISSLANAQEPIPHIEPRILLLDEKESQGFVRAWRPFSKGPEQNWSYALQWWGFAVLLLALYILTNIKKLRPTE